MVGIHRIFRTTLVVLSLAVLAGANRQEMALSWEDSTYEVSYSFETTCSLDTLYSIFHHPHHVSTYLKKANLDIEVLDTAEAWNKLKYSYKYYVSRLMLTFSRHIVADSQEVTFRLVGSVAKGAKVIPKVTGIYGVYHVVDSAGVRRVDYRQRTSLDRKLNRLYLFFIRRDTWRFLRDLVRYIEEHPSVAPQDTSDQPAR